MNNRSNSPLWCEPYAVGAAEIADFSYIADGGVENDRMDDDTFDITSWCTSVCEVGEFKIYHW